MESGIYFLSVGGDRFNLEFLEFATGRRKQLLEVEGRPRRYQLGLAVSSDESRVVFTREEALGPVLSLIEDLR